MMKYSSLTPASYSSADNVALLTASSSTGWRDLPWALLFCAHLAALTGVSAWLLVSGRGSPSTAEPLSYTDSNAAASFTASPLFLLFAAALLLSVLLSLAYLSLLRVAPARVIRVTLYATAGLLLLSTVAALLSGSLYGALASGLLFVLQLLWLWSVQRRIAFSALLVELSVQCVLDFPSTLAIPLCGLLAQSVWLATWLLCFSTLRSAMAAGRSSAGSGSASGAGEMDGGMQALFATLLLSYYWTAMVITYVVHTAVAGVAGTWYFLWPDRTPVSPVWSSLRRSLTTSLGSVCLGALIVAAVRTVRALLNNVVSRTEENRERSAVLACALYCAQCLLSLIEGVVQSDRTPHKYANASLDVGDEIAAIVLTWARALSAFVSLSVRYINTYALVLVGVYGEVRISVIATPLRTTIAPCRDLSLCLCTAHG